MRYLQIPAPVQPATVLGKVEPNTQPFTFREFLAMLAGDAKLTAGRKGGDAILLAADIAAAVRACPIEIGAVLALENDHADRLLAVLADPSEPFNPRSMATLAPFVRALRGMTEQPPATATPRAVAPQCEPDRVLG